jgi:FMN phosphatase YigB (HAD superfamily)
MLDTILIDLDGTLLPFYQDRFVDVYFTELKKVFIRLGLDPDLAIKAVWAGTKAMMLNDGSVPNARRFWNAFASVTEIGEEKLKTVEDACDSFYANEFDTVKSIITPSELPRRLIRGLAARGYGVVLATNPLFPACAVTTRLRWIGLEPEDFIHITDYSNSFYCKPNPKYYAEIFKATGRRPEQCLMAGNNPREDMCAGTLGAKTFLVTDYLEKSEEAFPAEYTGTLAELENFLTGQPSLAAR